MGPARSTLSQSQKENSCNLLRASPHVLSVLEDKHPNGINTETMGLSKRKRKAYTYEEFRLWAGSKELADHIWNTASPVLDHDKECGAPVNRKEAEPLLPNESPMHEQKKMHICVDDKKDQPLF